MTLNPGFPPPVSKQLSFGRRGQRLWIGSNDPAVPKKKPPQISKQNHDKNKAPYKSVGQQDTQPQSAQACNPRLSLFDQTHIWLLLYFSS